MFRFVRLFLGMPVRFFRVRQSLLLENLALRQQLAVLKRRRRSPCLSPFDKLFWVAVSRFWSGWKQAHVVVTPETVIRWHRAGFRLLSLAKTLGVLSFTPLTMLQACAQAVDFKVGHHFGEGHPRNRRNMPSFAPQLDPGGEVPPLDGT